MEQTITKLKLNHKEMFVVTHWERVVHIAKFGSHTTVCGLYWFEPINKQDVQSQNKSLCNGCFRG